MLFKWTPLQVLRKLCSSKLLKQAPLQVLHKQCSSKLFKLTLLQVSHKLCSCIDPRLYRLPEPLPHSNRCSEIFLTNSLQTARTHMRTCTNTQHTHTGEVLPQAVCSRYGLEVSSTVPCAFFYTFIDRDRAPVGVRQRWFEAILMARYFVLWQSIPYLLVLLKLTQIDEGVSLYLK